MVYKKKDWFDLQLRDQTPAFKKEFTQLSKEVGYETAKKRFRIRHYNIFD